MPLISVVQIYFSRKMAVKTFHETSLGGFMGLHFPGGDTEQHWTFFFLDEGCTAKRGSLLSATPTRLYHIFRLWDDIFQPLRIFKSIPSQFVFLWFVNRAESATAVHVFDGAQREISFSDTGLWSILSGRPPSCSRATAWCGGGNMLAS